MYDKGKNEENRGTWESKDPRLLRAARKIIRLYDIEQAGLIAVKPESLAAVIANELNRRQES